METNVNGDPIVEHGIYDLNDLGRGELEDVVMLLMEHLKLVLYRTNLTKHGITQLELRAE